jgi:hypothetical protein
VSRQSVRPNSFCVRPADFGKADPIEWVRTSDHPDSGASKGAFNAAQTQHRVVLRIRKKMAEQGLTIGSFSQKAGISEDFAGKLLLGVKRMRVEDIEAADLGLGGVSDWTVWNEEKIASSRLDDQQLASIRSAAVRDRFLDKITTAVDDLLRG